MINPGEDLLYEVSFLGIKLGSIRIVTKGFENHNDKRVCKAKAFIDSYKGIPFIDLHTTFESWFDENQIFSYKFNGHTKEENYWLFDQILFDYDNGKVGIEKWKKKQKYYGKTIINKKKINDGLSIFFFARQFVRSKKYVKLPTIIDKDIVHTYINFQNKKGTVVVDAINHPVKCIYFNGKTEWTGLYGLNGSFEGWFSDDDARIPIKAKMNLYVGSVLIQLKKWSRGGWTPPG